MIKNKNNPTVMFLEWATEGREFEMLLPIIFFFEKILKWNILYKSQFNLPSVNLSKVNLIISSGIGGSTLDIVWAKRIKKLGIPIITQLTEGIFGENDIVEEVWGHNIEKLDLETRRFLWSDKSLNLTKKYFPDIAKKCFVSGSIGTDKYKIIRTKKTYNKKVIGFAGCDFLRAIDHYENHYLFKHLKHLVPELKKSKERILKTLEFIADKNLDKILLIKPHPGEQLYDDVYHKLRKRKNVIILKWNDKIIDAVSNSDIWLTFNSTTVIDAWYLNIPTIQLNSNPDFFPANLDGCLFEENPEKIQNYINEYFTKQKIVKFEKLFTKRKKTIDDTIGFIDGFNHLRLILQSQDIIKSCMYNKITFRFELKDLIIGYLKHYFYTICKLGPPLFFKKRKHIYKRWDIKKMELEKLKFFSDIELFYSQNKKNILELVKLYSKNNKNINIFSKTLENYIK